MLKNLFVSQIRIELLKRFLLFPDREYYMRELVEATGSYPNAVRLELQNLLSIQLLHKRISGNQHYYRINTAHQFYNELQKMFIKSVGLSDVIAGYLTEYKADIVFAFIYGSMADGTFTSESDIDMMLIGNISPRKFSATALAIGNELGRIVNYSIMAFHEFETRLGKNDHFITTIINRPKLLIMGDSDEFERLGTERLAEKA